jgi:hypothetical protein
MRPIALIHANYPSRLGKLFLSYPAANVALESLVQHDTQ